MAVKTNGRFLIWIMVVMLGAAVLLSLSAWQWQRAAEKERWLKVQALSAQTDVMWLDGHKSRLWQSGQRVKLSGRFEPQCRVALDNQPAHGKTGYQLHQLFRLDNSRQAVLVNLGWLPSDRQQGPAVPEALKEQAVVMGDIQKPGQFYTAGGAEMLNGLWRVGRVDLAEWQARCQTELLPWVVRLSPEQKSLGYLRDWRPTETQKIGPDKHRAYAFQWLALAITWCLCWWHLARRSSSVSTLNKQKGASRWVVLALLLSFTLPFFIGQLAYDQQWIGGGKTNKGQLFTPPVALRESLPVTDQQALNGRWWLSYVLPEQCMADCAQSITTLTRLQETLGKERGRVGLLLIKTERSASIALPPASSEIHLVTVQQASLKALGFNQSARSPWMIMDPQGWVMLRYEPPLTAPDALISAQNLLDDLKKLLKASRIG